VWDNRMGKNQAASHRLSRSVTGLWITDLVTGRTKRLRFV
jgi:hypothetical protein